MAGRSAEKRAGNITQLGFDTLTQSSVSDEVSPEKQNGQVTAASNGATFAKEAKLAPHSRATAIFGESRQFAAPRRRSAKKKESVSENVQQSTLDDLFATISRGTDIPRSLTITESAPLPASPRQLTQLDFFSQAAVPSNDAQAVPESKPAGSGTEGNLPESQRSDVRPAGSEQNGVSGFPGESKGNVPAARRRVILDEPEPERQPSRDFRITSEHGIGSGGLHEKAHANIAAIRLLKTLEAENREATDEEKAVLVRYSGWGALAGVFEISYRRKPEWNTVATELKQLLTSEEYQSAQATTPNAHYTSPVVIQAIWNGLHKLGAGKGATILEPACGIGHFFGLMPPDMRDGTRIGVELDSITASIAKKLYPDTTIFAQGFEDVPLPDNYVDVVVGNVPFGDYAVHDPQMKHSLTRSIHDYFFAKSLEKVRPGGIMALITSRYTMDKKDDVIRKYLAERADLVASIRLPNTAFKGNAGTEVTTDILILQKRVEGKEPAGESWTETETVEIEGHPVALNEYYIRHPHMMLGQMTLKGTMYRDNEPTLAGELTEDSLRKAIEALPKEVFIARGQIREQLPVIHLSDPEQFSGIKDGGYAEIEGKIVKRNGLSFEPTSYTVTEAIRVRGLIQIRNAVREVFRTQLDDEPEEQITRARQRLHIIYDQFVRRHGFISSKENKRVFTGDPDHPLLLSLENYNEDTQTAAKSRVFHQRTIERYKPVERVETASEALAVSLNETGGIKWERMQSLTGFSLKELQAELGGQVYHNPEGEWETADEYLSGDVRAKLRTAEAAAAINPVFLRNVEALQAVQPADILPGEINARLGSGWIPRTDIRDFIADLLHVPQNKVAVGHASEIATWSIMLDSVAANVVANTTTYGTTRIAASTLIEEALNMRIPTIYDTLKDDTRVINQTETIAAREAQQKLKDRFVRWIWEDAARTDRLARLYNNKFNTIRLRTYDGSHLTFPGMNRTGLRNNDLDTHQKSAVWRMLQNKKTLIAHCVGAGKTAEMTAACMELKRLGLAKKPMICVPNHLTEQWGSAFLQLYPQANIFVAGKDFFHTGNREKAMARIASGNYDAVIISHKSFESLPVADVTFTRFVQKEIDSLTDAILEAKGEKNENRSIVKQLEKAKKRLEAKLKDRAGREKKDDGVTFEQLGIDRIFVDEADLFKNLEFTTKMQRIAGLPNTGSNRALDMYMKTRFLAERGGGIVFATGTPISNTMAEMYTILRYLAPELLEKAGVAHFDSWAANFGETVTALELAPDGSGYRVHTRFAKFVNLPELLSMFRMVADIQTAEMLNLPRPKIAGGKPQVVDAPATPQLQEFVSTLVDRAQRIRTGSIDPRIDNMLKITTDGRKAALDMRLVREDAEVTHKTKISLAVNNIYRIWKQTAGDKRLTQIAFCDISTPATDRFNVYDEIKALLMKRGIPEKEIAFIHDADTDAKKKTLFDGVNAGRVRILLGSTEKLGAGTNVQRLLKAQHDLDAPWRPRDVEQRRGRIERQGNENDEVEIYRYVTQGSFDAYMWQVLETKARFIQQVIRGDVTVREVEDLENGALSYAEIKAIASGNPAVMEKVRIDTEVRKLDMLRAAHVNQHYEIQQMVRDVPRHIANSKEVHAGLREDIATRNANETEAFTLTVDGVEYTGKNAREEAGTAILQAIMASVWEDKRDETLKHLGHFKGFTIVSKWSGREGEIPSLYVRGIHTYEVNLNSENALGTIASIEHVLRRLDRELEEEQAKIERLEKALAEYTEQLHRPFEHEEKLRELLLKQQEINRSLDLDKGDSQAIAVETPQDAPEADTFTQHLAARRTAHVHDPTEADIAMQHIAKAVGEYS